MSARIPFQRVGVLMGGQSSEREISLRSGKAVLQALEQAGVPVIGLDMQGDWAKQLAASGIDAAFNLLHGTWGEDGCIQGMLEIMRIPYTGSGVTASALCMHKQMTKAVLNHAGLKTPVDIPFDAQGPVRYPVIFKPVSEGSSVGLHALQSAADWDAVKPENLQDWMAEMPVKGVEIAVSVLNGTALPPVEVAPISGVYDFQSKYTAGATEYFCPARLPAETLRYCMQIAEKAVLASACRGAPRIDMIVPSGGEPAILEINTLPGMTETSLMPKSAAAAGIDFGELCLQILAAATLDQHGAVS